jgi:hypothetical protein
MAAVETNQNARQKDAYAASNGVSGCENALLCASATRLGLRLVWRAGRLSRHHALVDYADKSLDHGVARVDFDASKDRQFVGAVGCGGALARADARNTMLARPDVHVWHAKLFQIENVVRCPVGCCQTHAQHAGTRRRNIPAVLVPGDDELTLGHLRPQRMLQRVGKSYRTHASAGQKQRHTST